MGIFFRSDCGETASINELKFAMEKIAHGIMKKIKINQIGKISEI